MTTYVYRLEQTIYVDAESQEEAQQKLPSYPSGYEGQQWSIVDEHIDLLYSKEKVSET